MVLNPILEFYGINIRASMEKLDEKSDSDPSLERKYLRHVLICFYGSSLDKMAHKIRDEASKCMNQLMQSPSGYKLVVSWSMILDNLCLQSLCVCWRP